MNQLLSTEQLKKATGYKNVADIEKCLQKNHIRVIYGKKGNIFTTTDAINNALGIKTEPENDDNDIELL